MIVKEFYETRGDGVRLFKSYSDKNVMIHKIGTNEFYTATIDVENAPFVYEETELQIESEESI